MRNRAASENAGPTNCTPPAARAGKPVIAAGAVKRFSSNARYGFVSTSARLYERLAQAGRRTAVCPSPSFANSFANASEMRRRIRRALS